MDLKRILVLLLFNIILITGLAVASPYFFTRANLTSLLDNMALEVVALCGITLLLIGGYFDLSVDGCVALSGLIAGKLMNAGIFWPVAAFAGLLTGTIVGLINGIIVVRLEINGLIATLGTWWICVGITYGITKGLAPYDFPEGFQWIGQARLFGFRILVVWAVLAVVFMSLNLHLGQTGNHVFGMGGSKESARALGVNTIKLGIMLYVLVGLLAGFVGIATASKLDASSPMAVDGMVMRLIAASVLGGCALSGGQGSIVGGVLGLLVLNILGNAIILLGISPYWQKAVLGSILLIAVLSERTKIKRKVQYV